MYQKLWVFEIFKKSLGRAVGQACTEANEKELTT